MKRTWIIWLTIAAMLIPAGCALADDAAAKAAPAEKTILPVVVQPNEQRVYSVAVTAKGKATVEVADKPLDLDSIYVMKIHHQYGVREKDALLPLEISATDVQATANGEKLAVAPSEFPRLSLLLDMAWKITNIFGITGSRYAEQSTPGFSYGNLIALFFLPDTIKPHAIGETWTSNLKLPEMPMEASVTTTIKSVGSTGGQKTMSVHQDYVWRQPKTSDPAIVANGSKSSVDSVFALDSGKLLACHVEEQVSLTSTGSSQQMAKKIDIALDKPAAGAH